MQLPLKEFELLELLLRNAGRVLTRVQLIDRVWGSDYVGDTKTLDVQAISSFGYAPVTLLPPPGWCFRLAQQLGTSTFGVRSPPRCCGCSRRIFDCGDPGRRHRAGTRRRQARPSTPSCARSCGYWRRCKVALYPALLLLLGFGRESKITLVAADALFPILLSTYYGASMVEKKLIWSAMAAGTPRRQILFKVVLPAAVRRSSPAAASGWSDFLRVVFLAE